MRIVLLAVWAAIATFQATPQLRQPAPSTIRVTLLGTGNPRPAADRFGPSILVEAGTERLLVDAGRGSTIRLFEVGSAPLLSGITAVLLTHLHSDHVVGLPDLWLTGWLFGRTTPLDIYGPAGTREMASGFERAFAFDVRMRRDIDEHLPASGVEMRPNDVAPGVILERSGVRVLAFAVDHGPVNPALGYRIDYGTRSVVLSGDTRYSTSLIEAARGADVLVHEVLSPEVERRRGLVDAAAMDRIIAHHVTPEEAGKVFTAVSPRLAVYSHIVPSPATAGDLVAPTRRTYKGRLAVGYDLMEILIGDAIVVRKRATIPE
jgi:ribonuclease Z